MHEALTLAIAPASDHPRGLDLEGLISYLSEHTGVSINLHRCESYSEAMTALADGTAQIGWLGSYAFKEMSAGSDSIEAFAVGVPKGKLSPNYNTLFIVRPDSKIRVLSDVRHSSIALGDIYSTSGYDVPKRELADIGIELETEGFFKTIRRVSTHDEAIRAVL